LTSLPLFATRDAVTKTVTNLNVEPMPVRDSRVCAPETMPAGSFTFQLERQFVDVAQEPSGSARQRADLAVGIGGTFVAENLHNVDCIVDRYFAVHY
jgi:hypothetical protein